MRSRYGFEHKRLRETYDDGAYRFHGGYAIYDRQRGGPDPVAYILEVELAQKIVYLLNENSLAIEKLSSE